jgi:hypothetical protein
VIMSLIEELQLITGVSRNQVALDDEWDEQLTLWTMAWLLNCSCDVVEGKKQEATDKYSITDAEKKLFVPPMFVIDTPFPETEDWWWGSVRKVVDDNKTFDDKGKPNYHAVMSGWKDGIEKKHGLRPARTKERSMTDQIKGMVSKSASIMRRARAGGGEFSSKELSDAARMLASRGHQKKKAETRLVKKSASTMRQAQISGDVSREDLSNAAREMAKRSHQVRKAKKLRLIKKANG